MNQALMLIMSAGVVLGGMDRILGNKLGLGEAFEKGFLLLGPMALSMTGMICLTPVLADVLSRGTSFEILGPGASVRIRCIACSLVLGSTVRSRTSTPCPLPSVSDSARRWPTGSGIRCL